MLRKINEGGVIKDGEFSMQILSRESLEYQAEEKITHIEITYQPETKIIHIYATKAKFWKKSNEEDEITENEKEKMKKNIKEAVNLLTGNFKVI